MRKLVLAAVAAVAAMAFMAPSASAETEAPVNPNQSGTISSGGSPCEDVSKVGHDISGGCTVHAAGQDALFVSHTIFGESTQARCDNEFIGRIDSSGNGWIPLGNVSITHPDDGGINCTHAEDGTDACGEASASGEGHPGDWQIAGYEDSTGGDLWMDVEICLEGTSVGVVTGDLWVRVNTDASGNVTGFSSQDHRLREETVTGDVEFDGSWAVEGDTVSISH